MVPIFLCFNNNINADLRIFKFLNCSCSAFLCQKNIGKEVHAYWMLSQSVFRIRIHLIRIRIPHFRRNTNPDLQSGSRFMVTNNFEKNLQLEQKNIFVIKNCNLPIPRPP
jgi:hypothetical protein